MVGIEPAAMSHERDAEKIQLLADELRELVVRSGRVLKDEALGIREICEDIESAIPEESYDELLDKTESISQRLLEMQKTAEQGAHDLGDAVTEITQRLDRLQKEAKDFRTLYETGGVISSEMNLDRLLETVMDLVLQVTKGERGFVVLVEADDNLNFRVARNIEHDHVDKPEFEVSRGIIQSTISKGEITLIRDAQSDVDLMERTSVVELGLKSILCAPLRSSEGIIGVVYVENRAAASAFTEDDARLLGSLAKQISRGIENARRHTNLARSREKLLQELGLKYNFEEIVGNSPQILSILELIASVADTDATALVSGESGTGKELIARALHYNSSRRDKPFITLNCAAIPENLLESELFGHVRGAFTGASESRTGRFEAANHGTIFLDEIGDMPLNLQMKILRVLERKEIERLGSNKTLRVDVRVVAATNKNLREAIKEGMFREDLFHRLNVIGIDIPPLSERREDIMLLASHFTKRFWEQMGKPPLGIDPQCQRALENYSYPGNVRELENMLKRAVILCKGDMLSCEDLPRAVRDAGHGAEEVPTNNETLKQAKVKAREDASARIEKAFLIETLRSAGGVVSRAAASSGMHRVQYHRLLSKHGIDPKDYSGN
jgi:Nif-specific regulatory protein